jgi:phosphate transport system permease protein
MTTTSLTSSRGAGRAGDKVFSGAALAAGCLILAVLFGVALFLVIQAIPAFTAPAADIQGGEGFFAYIWPIVVGTLIAAIIALAIATPVSIGVALFISHFAPRGLASRPRLRH